MLVEVLSAVCLERRHDEAAAVAAPPVSVLWWEWGHDGLR